MSEFVVKHGVPILDEHEIVERDDQGNEVFRIKVDARRLQHIARRNNQRVNETGDEIPIVIGHTKDDIDETAQPEIVGYARNFSVGPLFRSGRQAIKATFRLSRDKLDLIKRFPRRSVELWISDWKLDPIALLGATTPERDLGLLRLSRGGKAKIRRVMPQQKRRYNADPVVGGGSGDAKSIANEVLAMLKQSDVWRWAESQMQSQMENADDGVGDPMMGDGFGDPGLGDDDPGFMDDEYTGETDPALDGDEEEEPQRYNAGYPGGFNTHTQRVMRSRPQVGDELHRGARERDALAQYQAGYAQLSDRFDELQYRYQRSERRQDLLGLQAEGIAVDVDGELDDLAELDEPTYQRFLARMRRSYARAPVGERVDYAASGRTRSGGPTSREDAQRIQEFAMAHGLSYSEAKARIEGDPLL